MDSNTHSASPADTLTTLAAVVDQLAAQDLEGLPTGPGPNGSWSCGGWWTAWKATGSGSWPTWTPGGGRGRPGPAGRSTASRLRARRRMGPTAATGVVRTARARFRGPLPGTAAALTGGERSVAQATVLAAGTQAAARPAHRRGRAGAGRGGPAAGPTRLRRVIGHLRLVADPTAPTTPENAATSIAGCA